MNREKQEDIDRQIAEQAAEWLDTLATSDQQQAAFADWVAASPRHLEEFLFVSAIEGELAHLDPEQRLNAGALLEAAKGNVLALRTRSEAQPQSAANRLHVSLSPSARPSASSRWRWAASVAALSVSVWLAYAHYATGHGYATAVGEQRTVHLTDGSLLQLNSKSHVEMKLTTSARDIELIQGEAMFKVVPDPGRPFRVHAAGVTIQVIGTQFNVNQRPSGITVTVMEGRVRISGATPIELGAGEEARVNRAGAVERRGSVDPASTAAWRQHRLVFRDDTLEDIVAEFNRYNTEPKISLEGEGIASRRYTAVFDASDPASLVSFLRQDGTLRVDSQGGDLAIRSR